MPDPIAVQMLAARRRRGWSLRRMADATGMSDVVVGSYERGDRQPSLLRLREWLAHLGYELLAAGPASAADGPVTVEHAVRYERPDADGGLGLVLCDTADEAAAVAAFMHGGTVVSRQVRHSEWKATFDAG